MMPNLLNKIKKALSRGGNRPAGVVIVAGGPEALERRNLVPRLEVISEQLHLGGVADVAWFLIGAQQRYQLPVKGMRFLLPEEVAVFVAGRPAIFIGEDQYHVANEWVSDLLARAARTGRVHYPEGFKDDPPNQIAHQRLRGAFIAAPSELAEAVAERAVNWRLNSLAPELSFADGDLPHVLVDVTPENMTSIFRQCVRLDRPINFTVELNSTCNYTCLMCPYHGGRQKRTPYFLGPAKATEMPIERFKEIIDEIAALDRPYEDENLQIRVTPYRRGELLYHPHWREALAYIKEKGFNLYFSTNGSLWTDDDIRYVVDIGVDLVQVSINGYDTETHSRLRLNDEYDKVAEVALKMVRTRIEMGRDTPKVQANNLLNEHTVGEIPKYLDYWLPRVDQIFLSPESYTGEGNNKIYKTEFNEFEEPDISLRPTCAMVKDYFFIDADGKCILCMGAKSVKIGNYGPMSVQELIDSPVRQNVIRQHAEGDFNNPTCKNCGHWLSQIYYPKEEKSDHVVHKGPSIITYTRKNDPIVDQSVASICHKALDVEAS